MSINKQRLALFLIGCMGSRFGISEVARRTPNEHLPVFGGLALLPAIGFLVISLMGWRQRPREAFGDRVWWGHLRPVHAFTYFFFAYMAFNRDPNSWKVLLGDAIFGLLTWASYHACTQGLVK